MANVYERKWLLGTEKAPSLCDLPDTPINIAFRSLCVETRTHSAIFILSIAVVFEGSKARSCFQG